jgi:hypothetical protein
MATLIDTANAILERGGVSDVTEFVGKCVAAGTAEAMIAVKLLARDMYGGITFNYELKAPAVYGLIAWGAAGMAAIRENASEEESVKNYSLAITVLSSLVAGQFPAAMQIYVRDSDVVSAIKTKAGDPRDLRDAARKNLTELLMSIPDLNQVALYVGVALNRFVFSDTDAVRHLFQALATRFTSVGLPQLAEYEKLIRDSPDQEPAFHAFFERNPLFLDPLSLRVWSRPDFHGKKEPDFLIQRTDNSYVVVEIETPGKMLVTGQNQLSAETTHAITQAIEYRAFVSERFSTAASTFPNFAIPECLVVVGTENGLTTDQSSCLRRENEHRPAVSIVGFDALARRTRAITENVIRSSVVVERVRLA